MKLSLLIFALLCLSESTFSQTNYDTISIVSRLNFKLLDPSVINDETKKSGNLEDFLNDEGLQLLNEMGDSEIDLGKVYITKSFKHLKTDDSISIGRQGNVVSMPPFWATFNMTVPADVDYGSFLRRIKKSYPIVIYAHPNYKIEYMSTPNDTLYQNQESLYSDSAGIMIDSAWTINTGERWVKVGVFDSGIDSTHPDLNVLTGWAYSDLDSVSWGVDIDGHGTQVAGIIGARRNNDSTGVAGIAGGNGSDTSGVSLLDFSAGSGLIENIENWCVSIINSVRVPGTYYDWGQEVGTPIEPYYYDHAPGYGVHINNFSTIFRITELEKGPTEEPTSPPGPSAFGECNLCQEAFLFSIQNGVVSTASRGNPELGVGVNPATYEGPRIYPAGFHDSWVMSTGSSGNDGERLIQGVNSSSLYFSANRQDIDIIAPGSFDIVYTTESSAVDTSLYGYFDGTSAAAPHTAGVAALLLSHYNKPCYSNINLDPADVEYIIQKSATQTQENIDSNGYHPGSGWGRLNAFEALKMIDFPEYQIVHPIMPYFSRQTVEVDTISINYFKPLNSFGSGPLGAGFPLELEQVYKVVRYKEQLAYNFGQFMLDSTVLLDAWVRHGQTNSAIFNADTTKQYFYDTQGFLEDSLVTGADFGIEQMAYIDSIVNDSLIYLSGYYYHFIEKYVNTDINILLYTNASLPVSYWYPYNPYDPLADPPKMTYSIYIHDTTLLTRYDFPCTGENMLLDSLAEVTDPSLPQFKLYPNPGTDELNILLGDSRLFNARLKLFDASGRLIQEVTLQQDKLHTLSVANLKSGFYFVNLECPSGDKLSKIWIKQ